MRDGGTQKNILPFDSFFLALSDDTEEQAS